MFQEPQGEAGQRQRRRRFQMCSWACRSPAARAARQVDGRPHGRRLANAEHLRVECPVCLHGTSVPACAEFVTASQVNANRVRPPPGDVGAPLRTMVLQECAPTANATSVRHVAQVGRGVCFTPTPAGSSSPLTSHSPAILASLVLLTLAQSIAVAIITASEVEGVCAVGLGSILVDSGAPHRVLPEHDGPAADHARGGSALPGAQSRPRLRAGSDRPEQVENGSLQHARCAARLEHASPSAPLLALLAPVTG